MQLRVHEIENFQYAVLLMKEMLLLYVLKQSSSVGSVNGDELNSALMNEDGSVDGDALNFALMNEEELAVYFTLTSEAETESTPSGAGERRH